MNFKLLPPVTLPHRPCEVSDGRPSVGEQRSMVGVPRLEILAASRMLAPPTDTSDAAPYPLTPSDVDFIEMIPMDADDLARLPSDSQLRWALHHSGAKELVSPHDIDVALQGISPVEALRLHWPMVGSLGMGLHEQNKLTIDDPQVAEKNIIAVNRAWALVQMAAMVTQIPSHQDSIHQQDDTILCLLRMAAHYMPEGSPNPPHFAAEAPSRREQFFYQFCEEYNDLSQSQRDHFEGRLRSHGELADHHLIDNLRISLPPDSALSDWTKACALAVCAADRLLAPAVAQPLRAMALHSVSFNADCQQAYEAMIGNIEKIILRMHLIDGLWRCDKDDFYRSNPDHDHRWKHLRPDPQKIMERYRDISAEDYFQEQYPSTFEIEVLRLRGVL